MSSRAARTRSRSRAPGRTCSTRQAGPASGTLNLLNQGLFLQYKASGGIWYVIADDLPLSQLDLRYAGLSGATFTGHIAPAVVTLSQSGGLVAVNAALGNDLRLTLTASGWTISNPSNPVDGQGLVFHLFQDATGSRTVSWGTAYNFGAGVAPTLSTAANAVDILGFIYDSGTSKWEYAGGGGGSAATKPWEFPVSAYGAKGDGKIVTDGAMSSSGTTLACATSTPFTAGDVGKFVLVWGAGAATAGDNLYLFTHITAFTDSGHVTVADAAVASVSAAGVMFGTDDTAAVQAAIDAAVTYAQLGGGHAPEVVFTDAVHPALRGQRARPGRGTRS